ncbi:MAG: hypothetical protein M1833_001201 [Piccolia ochrophora]|nr:MAG: hypothetical protein M1833_001201 [Piccolia ochrophora]
MDSTQFRAAAHTAVDEITNYFDRIEHRRVVSDVQPGYLRKLLPEQVPEDGESWDDIQKDVESKIMPGLTHWQSPNFMAFFPATTTYPSMLGELYSAAFSAPAFNWICSPAVTELETIVLDWLAKLLHLPSCFHSLGDGGGVIQGSASEAIVTTMVAARERYLMEATKHLEGRQRESMIGDIRSRLVVLGSEMSHSSTHKAALITGTRYKSIKTDVVDGFSLTGESLRHAIEECQSEGLKPFYLTVTLGTTATCAVDDFRGIADVVRHHPMLWTHVDAAYAGAALICEEYQHLTEHFESFDSFDMNMHKWLLTNFDARHVTMPAVEVWHLIDALSVTPSYLRNEYSDSGLVIDYKDWQIPLGRRFRALKIWFVLRTYGAQGLKSYVREHIRLGKLFASWIDSSRDIFKILTEPAFALTAFHVDSSLGPDDGAFGDSGLASNGDHAAETQSRSLTDVNELTKEVYETVNRRGEIFLTSSVVNGIYIIRVVSANARTEEKYLRKAFNILVDTTVEVLDKARSKRRQSSGGVEKRSSTHASPRI